MHKKLFADFTKFSSRLSNSNALHALVNSILHPACIKAHEEFKILDPINQYKLSNRECDLLKIILVEIGELMERGHEPLGDLFMEFVSNGQNGQYFTPMNICSLMQQLVSTNEENKTQKSQNVHDPACGSGRMLLAAAVEDKSIHCFGTDIDELCCKMAAANMILHNLIADIVCGNELSKHYSHGYLIRRAPYFNFPILQIIKYIADDRYFNLKEGGCESTLLLFYY